MLKLREKSKNQCRAREVKGCYQHCDHWKEQAFANVIRIRLADSGKKIEETLIECYYPNPEDRVSHFTDMDTLAIVWVHIRILPFKWPRMLLNKILGK